MKLLSQDKKCLIAQSLVHFFPFSATFERGSAVDRSHIVGHVNSDGSIQCIRPVVNIRDSAVFSPSASTSTLPTGLPSSTTMPRFHSAVVSDDKDQLVGEESVGIFSETLGWTWSFHLMLNFFRDYGFSFKLLLFALIIYFSNFSIDCTFVEI